MQYKQNWKDSGAKIENLFSTFEAEHRSYKHDLLKTYDLYVKKLVSMLGLNQVTDHIPVEELLPKNLIRFSTNREFKGVYVDFEYMNLNGKLLNSYDRNFYPLDIYDTLKFSLPTDDQQDFDRIILLLNKENEQALETKELKKLRAYVESVSGKRVHMRYFFLYLSLYLSQKEEIIKFNYYVIELIEIAIEEYLPMVFTGPSIDYETLLYILYICYEINNNSMLFGNKGLSGLFLTFLKNLNCWYKVDCWNVFIENLEKFLENPYLSFHYLERQAYLQTGKKVNILYKRDMYQYLMLIGCHFLSLPFKPFMDTLNAINGKRDDVNLNYMVDLTKIVEVYMIGDVKIEENPKIHLLNKATHEEKICLVFKNVFSWFDSDDSSCLKMITCSSVIYRHLRKKLAKYYLASNVTKQQRLILWSVICSNSEVDATFASTEGLLAPRVSQKHLKAIKLTSSRHLLNLEPLGSNSHEIGDLMWSKDSENKPMSLPSEDEISRQSLEENFISLIKLDVKRTNFVKEHKSNLKKLLVVVARRYPTLMYYQGMNCIGGFLLNYTLNYGASLDIFSYMVETQLAESFQKSFIELSKLIFIAERLLEKYNKVLFDQLQKFTNSADFYLSPLILTIFSSSMQTIDTSEFIAVVFDYFLKEKWLGLFKVIVVLFEEIKHELLSLSVDRLAVYLKKDLFERLLEIDLALFKNKLAACTIQSKEVQKIEIEYNRSRKIVENYWREFYEIKRGRQLKI